MLGTYLGQAAVHGDGGWRGQGLLLQVLQGLWGGGLLLLLLQQGGLLLAVPVPQHPDEAVAQHGLRAGDGLPRLVVTQVLNERGLGIVLESNLRPKGTQALLLKDENISIFSKPTYKRCAMMSWVSSSVLTAQNTGKTLYVIEVK